MEGEEEEEEEEEALVLEVDTVLEAAMEVMEAVMEVLGAAERDRYFRREMQPFSRRGNPQTSNRVSVPSRRNLHQ